MRRWLLLTAAYVLCVVSERTLEAARTLEVKALAEDLQREADRLLERVAA